MKAKKIDEKTEIKKENKLLVILAIIFTSLVVIVTTMVFLLPEITKVKNVTVPDVSNMSVVDAENKLESLGLVVNEDEKEVSSSEVEAGKVVKTSPQAKRTVKKGASITLYVSSGENGYTVEDLTGKNYLEVKGALESTYNLYVIVSKMETDQTVDADVILKTDPAVGTVLKPGDTITLYIPLMNTSYPDFTKNYTLSQIQAWCEKYGVTYAEVYDQTSLYEAGTIYAQSIASGTTVQAGQTLTIHIAEAVDDSDNTGTDMGE